jgi:hypothetical protein
MFQTLSAAKTLQVVPGTGAASEPWAGANAQSSAKPMAIAVLLMTGGIGIRALAG